MKLILAPFHDLTPIELDEVEDRLYEYNRTAAGRDDGEGIGFVIRDDAGRTVGSLPGILGLACPRSSRCGSTSPTEAAATVARSSTR
jgi:hypothetical protein